MFQGSKPVILPPRMDPECISLCNAINSVPGLETFESCCGHGKSSFDIWFWAEQVRSLFVVARAIDRRYCGPEEWRCHAEGMDHEDRPVCFRLTSGDSWGPEAYARANLVTANIWEILNNETVVKMYRIGAASV